MFLSPPWYSRLSKNPKTTVIVVDDDASIRRALRTQLRALGFNVLVLQSGEELLAGEIPVSDTCLLLDVWMPGMSGIELCRSLDASGRHLPTVLMSGLDDERTAQMMREANTVASLFKPFDEKQLMRAIRKALSKGANLLH
jgi:FixJ family two-component response regulator